MIATNLSKEQLLIKQRDEMNSQLNKNGSELEIRARNQGKLEAEVSSLRQQISRLQFELKATKQEKEKLERVRHLR